MQIEDNKNQEKIGNLSMSKLLEALRETIKEEIGNFATRNEFDTLKTDVKALKDDTNASIKQITDSEQKLEKRIDRLEKIVRMKNIIIKGLPIAQSSDSVEKLTKDLITSTLGIDADKDFEKIVKLSEKGNQMMVLVTFKTVETINEIFAKAKKLKGTHIFISRDLSETEREVQRFLQRIRSNILSVDRTKKIQLKNNRKLVIDGQEYSWKDGKLWAGKEDGITAIRVQYGDVLKDKII